MGTKHKPHKSLTVVSPHTHTHTDTHRRAHIKTSSWPHSLRIKLNFFVVVIAKVPLLWVPLWVLFLFLYVCFSVSVFLVVLVFRTVISFSFRFGLKLCLMICYCCCFFLRNLPLLYAQIFSLFCFLFCLHYNSQVHECMLFIIIHNTTTQSFTAWSLIYSYVCVCVVWHKRLVNAYRALIEELAKRLDNIIC